MKKSIEFNWYYFVLTILLLGLEIIIALFAHDSIIRPYIGDLLVVILLYCFVKSFVNTPVFMTAAKCNSRVKFYNHFYTNKIMNYC